jgi:hypothetical protein
MFETTFLRRTSPFRIVATVRFPIFPSSSRVASWGPKLKKEWNAT